MKKKPIGRDFALQPVDAERLSNLCGAFDQHLRQIELRLGVEIGNRGNVFRIQGDTPSASQARKLIESLYELTSTEVLTPHQINLALAEAGVDDAGAMTASAARAVTPQEVSIRVKRGTIKGRGDNQQRYLHAIARHDISFGVGPAGTGKTYLAVASAVLALEESRV
jgi:phosphate starvation-inducible protein PhoH and related proteins